MLQYKLALLEYFKRFSKNERQFKMQQLGAHNQWQLVWHYIKNARHLCTRNNIIYIANHGVENNYPHTLRNIIILPIISPEIIKHEKTHIYFRNYNNLFPEQNKLVRQLLANYCLHNNLVPIVRPRFKYEITNPDVYDYYGLQLQDKIIFVVLERYKKIYYVYDGITRVANKAEIDYYNNKLPFEQNDHPEEIMATILQK